MKQLIRTAAVLLLVATLFSACTSVPDHARYVPADALMVMGVNTKQMSKEIAWSAITGSDILDNLKKENEKDAVKQLDQAGINWMSTLYAYVKAGKGLDDNTIFAGVLPLKNKSEWETFVKKQFPQAAFKQANGRTEASLDAKVYAGWNDKVLIVMNAIQTPAGITEKIQMDDVAVNTDDSTNVVVNDSGAVAAAPVVVPGFHNVDMTVAMDSAFAVTKDHSILQDSRFTKLEKQGHDITMWVNYEIMMNRYMGDAMTKNMGLSLSNTLWKGSAMASGIDFRKGKVTADMQYYTSEEMKEICRELGSKNADKEMIDRLPVQNMNMMMAWHLSPKGTKDMIEKAGMLGFLNIGLMSVGMSSDDIFETFTGDMAVSMSNFKANLDTSGGMTEADKPSMDYVYVMKIAKKENLAKLLNFAVSKEILVPAGKNMYQLPAGAGNQFVLANDDNYLVGTNKAEAAQAYLQGKNKGGKLPDEAQKAIYGHPMGGYFDVATIVKTMIPPASTSPADLALMEEAKKLVTDINFYGGSFSGNAFDSHATVNFSNKEENGLLQLIALAIKTKKAADEHHAANMASVPAPADTTTQAAQ